MKALVNFVQLIGWISGIVLAKGFWWKLLAFLFPLYSWYLVVKHLMILGGFL
jgi:hypothetical protein